jgi:hypothetical protein
MHPDYVWWGPMWFFPMVIPIIMLVAMVFCLYLTFGRGGFRPPGHNTDRNYVQGGQGSESALEILKGMPRVRSAKTSLSRCEGIS